MSKRFLMTLVALAGIVLQSVAQTDLKVPKFTKFVNVKYGVNVRKAPSTQSARLVLVEKGGRQEVKWEEASDDKANTQPVSTGAFYPVVDETPEWYHIAYDASKNVFAYVSKKYCIPHIISPINKKYITNTGNDLHIRTAGKYKGYCVMHGWFKSLFTENLYIGKLKNGVLVGKKIESGEYSIPEHLSQLTDNEIDKIFANTKNDNNTCFVYGVPESSEDRNGPKDGVIDVILDINQYEGATY